MASRHLHNVSITVVQGRTGCKGINEVIEFRSLDNTAVNQEAETEGTVVMSEFECSNCHSTFTTEGSVGMSTRQLQDLLTSVVTAVRTDLLRMMETILHSKQSIPV